MPDYVITARAPQGSTFSDDPGPTSFLEVPDCAPTTAPTQAIPRDDWVRKVIARAGRKRDGTGAMRGDVLVFIHGYDNEPPIVLRRHRRLQVDLPQHDYNGVVISFDWPAQEIALAYLEDREKAKLTAFRLVKDCIELFARMQSGADCDINVHLLAHSTGAYVVREAFDDADDRRAIAMVNWTASQVAFIGADVFAACPPVIPKVTRSIGTASG
jgi:alpha-beta hydrolase superfamily lysophospholipase